MLTIAGLILAVWFIEIVSLPNPAPLETFVVAAFSVAMISVGIRYIFKPKPQKPDPKK